MEYEVINDIKRANGTALRGYVEVEYSELVRVFGEPFENDQILSDGKVTSEWVVEDVVSGNVATIYDWKGDERDSKNVVLWHVGGRENEGALSFIKEVLFQNHSTFKIITMDEIFDYVYENQKLAKRESLERSLRLHNTPAKENAIILAEFDLDEWYKANNVPLETIEEIAEAHPDVVDRWEYVEMLCRHCFNELSNVKGRALCLDEHCRNQIDC